MSTQFATTGGASIRTPKADLALAPTNYFFACVANALHVANYLLHHPPISPTWLLDVDPFVWDIVVQEHFVPNGDKTKQIRTTSEVEMLECVEVLRFAFTGLQAPKCKLVSQIGAFLDDIERAVKRKDLGKAHYPQFAQTATRVIYATGRRVTKESRIKLTNQLIKDLLAEMIDVHDMGLPTYLANNLDRYVKRLAGSVSLADVYSGTIFGPYFILRKSRGAVTTDSRDSELIVRDMLWLRPLDQQPDAEGVRAEKQSQPTNALGYYISAMDSQVFEITNISVRGQFVMLDAVAFESKQRSKSICAYLPVLPMQENEDAAFASVVGTLRDRERTGAWTVLAVRPKMDEAEIMRLHHTLSFFADCFCAANYGSRTGNYDPNIDQVYKVFAEKGHCGVIYSRGWLDQARNAPNHKAGGVTLDDLEERMAAFDGCFAYTDQHMATLNEYIDGIIDAEPNVFADLEPEKLERIKQILKLIYRRSEQTAISPLAIEEQIEHIQLFADARRTTALPYRQAE